MSKIDWNKVGKWSLIIAPILIGGYLIYKQLNPKKTYNKPTKKDNPAPPPDKKTEASYFPLKVGSHNDYVGQLQDELGIAIDGIFGSQTLAALQSQTNKSQIKDYADLIATLTLIDNNDDIQAKSDDAKAFIDAYKSSPLGYSLVPSEDIRLTQLSNSAPYVYGGYYINWQNGITYQAQPIDVTSRGDLVIHYIDGNGNEGYWAVDSTLLNH